MKLNKKPAQLIQKQINLPDKIVLTHGINIHNTFPVHFHASFILGFIAEGQCIYHYRGEDIPLQKDDIYLVQSFVPHRCEPVAEGKHSYNIISFTLSSPGFFPQLKIADADLLHLLKTFHQAAFTENKTTSLSHLYAAIQSRLLTHATDQTNSPQKALDAIDKAKGIIEQNCHNTLSLDEIAEAACLSKFHFNRLFHARLGLSPYAYYLHCKVKQSQEILLRTTSVTTTSFETGFFDQSHFTKLFKKHVGVTPGKYLKSNRDGSGG
ncbi:AraC family transcriptional regulator [Marinilabiliaceae bacterium JC017]|nr:AraC family transcriptional regulator [Marinilabiliaceae bacterium JC017]